jgi:hypothetical protein
MTKVISILAGAAAVSLLAALPASAASIVSDYSKIQQIDTYAGDTIVFLSNNPAGCELGFWMRPTQDGFEEKLDKVEKAAHAQARVKVSGDGSDLWNQLEERNCRLESIEVEPVAHVTGEEKPVDLRNIERQPLVDENGQPVKTEEPQRAEPNN